MLFKCVRLLLVCTITLMSCLINGNPSSVHYFIRSCSPQEFPILRHYPSLESKVTLEKPTLHHQSIAPYILIHFGDIKTDEKNSVFLTHVSVMGYPNDTTPAIKVFEEMIVGWDMRTGKKLFQERFSVNESLRINTIHLCKTKTSKDGRNIFASYGDHNDGNLFLIGWNRETGEKIFQEEQGPYEYGMRENNIRFTKNDTVLMYKGHGEDRTIHKVFDISANAYLTGLKEKYIISSKNFASKVKKSVESVAEASGFMLLIIYSMVTGNSFMPR